MSKKTERNLSLALAAESQASARDTAFAQKADHDANPLLARLFRALAESESVHARRYLLLLRGKIAGSRENLESALWYDFKFEIRICNTSTFSLW